MARTVIESLVVEFEGSVSGLAAASRTARRLIRSVAQRLQQVRFAALSAGGHVEGVILHEFIERDVHHRGLADLASVGDMRQRKAGLAAHADAFVALPGGLGTLEEVSEILSFRKLGLHESPVVLVNTLGFFDPLVAQIEQSIENDFDDDEVRGYFALTEDPVDAVRLCSGGRS